MRLFYEPTKDASIYQQYSWKNAGFDEILEIGKGLDGANVVRSLIQFDIASISQSMIRGDIPLTASFDLKLFVARADDLNFQQSIECAIVSRSWVEGTGYYYQNTNVPFTASRDPQGGFTQNDGVTWKNRQSGSLWSATGSEFYTSSVSSTIAQPVVDMTLDVTPIIRTWLSGSYQNNGLIVKFPTSDELSHLNIGNIRFFSRNTHTVYSPQLIIRWNDQVYNSGSLSLSSPYQAIVTPRNLRPKYKMGEVVRIDLSVRDRYPVKTFDSTFSSFAGLQRLPTSSYFSIIDQQSNATIIPFDNCSTVSTDVSGSYFNFRIAGMYPGRYYKVMVKVSNNGYEQIFDAGHIFTIESV